MYGFRRISTYPEYIVSSDAAKAIIWMRKFIHKFGVLPDAAAQLRRTWTMQVIVQLKKPKFHQQSN